jgi:hypothetical protein
MLCRLFVDEVGNNDLKNAPTDTNVRYLSLTGLVIPRQVHDETIQPALDELKAEFLGHTPATPVILHRREIMERSGSFAVLRNDGVRTRFDEGLLAFIEHCL